MIAEAVCAMIVGVLPAGIRADRAATCEAIYREAIRQEVPAHVAIALGWHESRFNPTLRSSAGAVGPLQIKPRFYCPAGREEGCDLVAAGVQAIGSKIRKYRTIEKAACHYNQGNECGPKAAKFGRAVEATSRRVLRMIRRADRPRTS